MPIPVPDPSPPRRTPLGLWRGMPFTGQLLAIGMLVGLGWFLASRTAAERQQAEALARNADLVRLQRAEMLAGSLGRALAEMSRDHRGFLLSGDDRYLQEFGEDSVEFEALARQLGETARSARVDAELLEVRRLLGAWQEAQRIPMLERRRALGLAGVASGGATWSGEGMDATIRASDRLTRALADDVAETALLVDEAATRDDLSTFLTSTGGLAVLILLLYLLMRLVSRTLDRIIAAAHAIDAGRFHEVRFHRVQDAPNREMAALASAFTSLAASTEERERQLQDDIEKLKELERLKRDFVSTVSHELRTPLTSLRGALGLILGGKVGELPAKARELLQIGMTNTERLIRLINDILDVERMDAGAAPLRREPLRLRPLLETTVAGLDAFAREHKVRVTLDDAATDADLVGDPDRLVQVFTNLVSNAVKFSPVDGTVEVTAAEVADGVQVRVRDHGPGIPPEFAARIFGRFQQAGGADQRRSGGTGLGLNIARGLVEQHGGQIGFEPAAGGGTVFWVTLPASSVHRATFPPLRDPRRAVLVVEDDPSMRELLVAMIEPMARPIAVATGEEGFEVLARDPVGAVVLDLELPGMHGFEFSKRLRQDPRLRRLPVLLFSAREYSVDELRQAGIRAADAYVKTRDSELLLLERLKKELAAAG